MRKARPGDQRVPQFTQAVDRAHQRRAGPEKLRRLPPHAHPADGRFTIAILTDEGFQTLAAAAPGHVAHVRSLVIDVLSPEQLRRLGLAADRIMSHIDTSEIN